MTTDFSIPFPSFNLAPCCLQSCVLLSLILKLNSTDSVCIDQFPKGQIIIGLGGSTKLSAYVTTSSPESFIKWQKVEGNVHRNLITDSIKYSGSSCSLPAPELIINDVDNTDAGVYQLSVTTVDGTVTGPKVLLDVFGGKNCFLSSKHTSVDRCQYENSCLISVGRIKPWVN